MAEEKQTNRAFVYDTWYTQMVDLGESDKELAYDYIKAVLDSQFYGSYDSSNPVIKALMRSTQYSVNRAHESYAKSKEVGSKNKRSTKYDYQQIYDLKQDGKTNKEIMDIVGCSEKTISNAVNAIEAQQKKDWAEGF